MDSSPQLMRDRYQEFLYFKKFALKYSPAWHRQSEWTAGNQALALGREIRKPDWNYRHAIESGRIYQLVGREPRVIKLRDEPTAEKRCVMG